MIEIIHAGAAEVPVGYRKAGGLDDVGGHVEACAETENRPGVLRNIGLEKRYLHRVPAVPVSYEFSE